VYIDVCVEPRFYTSVFYFCFVFIYICIRMDLQEVGCGYMDWIRLAHDRDRWRKLVSAEMNLRVSWNVGSFLTSCKPVSFWRRTLHHGVSKYIYIYIYITVECQHWLLPIQWFFRFRDISWGQSGQKIKLTSHFHVMRSFRISGAIPLSPIRLYITIWQNCAFILILYYLFEVE